MGHCLYHIGSVPVQVPIGRSNTLKSAAWSGGNGSTCGALPKKGGVRANAKWIKAKKAKPNKRTVVKKCLFIIILVWLYKT